MDYISGRLDRLFIASAEDLRRLAEGEHLPDRDGTYRNQDFFSYDNTWRMVLGRLAGQCQAILMDLRNFGPQHAGCRHEIQALIHNVSLTKVVFIIDRTTKEALLSEALEAGWRDLPVTSPNRGMDPSQINLLRYEHSTDREFQQVLRALSHATVQHLASERGRAEQPKEGEGAEWQRGEQREENQNCREGPAQEKAPVRVEAEPATRAIWPDRGAMTELQATESFASEIPFERQLTPERVGGRQRRRGLSRPAVAWGVGALILLGAMCGCIILGSIDVVRSLSSNPTTTPQASINPPSMKNPDTIVELGAQPESLDPAWDDETGGGEILQNVYQPLVFYSREKTDQFVGVLASDWKTSLDGKTWTFAIRKGVRFANGDPMNPSDVAYSYLRGFTQGYVHGPQWVMLQPFFGASVTSGFLNPSVMPGDPTGDDVANTMYNGDFLAACQAAQKLIVADDTAGTVTMTLKQPWAPFLSSIAGTWASIIDKKWAIDLGDWDGTCATARQYNNPQYSSQTKLWNSTNGTGPYNVTRWDQGQRVRLDANPYYWQTQPLWAGGPSGAPQIQHVIVETVRRRDRQFSPATFAEADLASIPPTARDQIDPLVKEECGWDSATCTTVNPNGFLRVSKGLPGKQMGALFFNQNIKNVAGDANYRGSGKLGGNGIPPTFFANIHIRKAFVACFDHVTLIKQVFQGDGVHPSGPVIPGILSDDHGGPEQQFSLDTCKAEFDSAAKVPGYENLTDQGFVLPFAHLGGPDLVAGQNLAKNLAKINAKFRISFIESAPQFALSDQRRGALGLFYAEWREDYRAPHAWVTPFLASGGKYASAQAFDPVLQKQIDQLINEALGTADMNDRALIYAELYKLAFDNALDIFVVAPTNRHYEPTWMKGWYYNPILEGAPHAGYWYAYSKVAIR